MPDHDHTFLFASLGTADLVAATAWYERLLGRPPDLIPNDREAAWQVTEGGWVYLELAPERSGHSRVTLLVSDLDGYLAALAERGIEPLSRNETPGTVRAAELRDPDGNELQIAQPA